MLHTFCRYKAAERGGQCLDVSAKNTSRECCKCGHIAVENRGSQARFLCVQCGHTENADDNASVVILKRAVDCGLLPVEALHYLANKAGITVGHFPTSCQ